MKLYASKKGIFIDPFWSEIGCTCSSSFSETGNVCSLLTLRPLLLLFAFNCRYAHKVGKVKGLRL